MGVGTDTTGQEISKIKTPAKVLESDVTKFSGFDSQYTSDAGAEIDLKELLVAVWNNRWLVVIITVLFTIASVGYSLSLQNIYKSTTILVPAASSSSSSLTKLSGQLGGLASLAGVRLGGSTGNDKAVIAMELVKTWDFLEKYIQENDLEVQIYAVKGWNRINNQLVYNEDIYDPASKTWLLKDEFNNTGAVKPSSWKLFQKIKSWISISMDKQSGLVSLSVEYYSPILAREMVDKLVIAINKHIQLQDRKDAMNSIKYLKEQISKTNLAEMQSVFYQLIEEQTKTLMLAEISDEYVFKTLSPAKIPEQESKPKRVIIVILGTFFGFVFALAIVLLRHLKDKT